MKSERKIIIKENEETMQNIANLYGNNNRSAYMDESTGPGGRR